MDSLLNRLIANGEKPVVSAKVKPRTSQSLRDAIVELVNTENKNTGTERRVSINSAFTVASRSLDKTKHLDKSVRLFIAYRDVASFITLAHTGSHKNNNYNHLDLLPIGHPLSVRITKMSPMSLREAQARWIAADPRIDDSVKELVASAYSQVPGTIEHIHAFSRVQALTAGLVPQELLVASGISALVAGGNDSFSRSMRARLQRRDRHGRFAEEGGGMHFWFKGLDGVINSVIGRFAGNVASSDSFLIEVHGDKNLKDGLYEVPTSKADALKAVLPKESVKNLPIPQGAKDSDAVDIKDLKTVDHPDGWDVKVTKPELTSYVSDDNYKVVKYNPINGSLENNPLVVKNMDWFKTHGYVTVDNKFNKYATQGSEIPAKNVEGIDIDKAGDWKKEYDLSSPIYIVFRTDDNGKTIQNVGVSQSWADTQDFTEKDSVSWDKEKEDQQKHVQGMKEKEVQQAEKEKQHYADAAQKKIDDNLKAIADFKANVKSNKDLYGNDLPQGWTIIDNSTKYPSSSLDTYTKEYMEQRRAEIGDKAFSSDLYAKVPTLSPEYLSDYVKYQNNDGNVTLIAEYGKDRSLTLSLGLDGIEGATVLGTSQKFDSWKSLEDGLPQWKDTNKNNAIKQLTSVLEPYDKDGKIADLINSGASWDEINSAINDLPVVKNRDDNMWAIDLPTPAQKAKMAEDERISKAIAKASYFLSSNENKNEKTPTPTKEEKAPEVKAELPKPEETSTGPFTDWTTPAGAYKLQNKYEYEPQGRIDEQSSDFTDDPKVLANKFSTDELISSLSGALIGKKDVSQELIDEINNQPDEDLEEEPQGKSKPGPKKGSKKKETPQEGKVVNASGSGALEFKSGEEFVPAEAIYEALKEQGEDADKIVAGIYDSQLGQNTNTQGVRGETKQESIQAETPTVENPLDEIIPSGDDILRINAQLAQPLPAARSIEAMDNYKSEHPTETNQKMIDLANEISKKGGSSRYEDILKNNISLAFSDNPDDKSAFNALWGLVLSHEGGDMTYQVSPEEKLLTDFAEAVKDAIKSHNGTVSDKDFLDFLDKHGDFSKFVESRKNIANGTEDMGSPDSLAGNFYRLMQNMQKDSTTSLYRGFSVNSDNTDTIARYTTPGEIISIDPRPFSKDEMTAAMYAGSLGKPTNVNGVDESSILVEIKDPAPSVDTSSFSMFSDEMESIAWGNYRIVSVDTRKNKAGRTVHLVQAEHISPRQEILDGYNNNYQKFLTKNDSVDLPEGYHVMDPDPYVTSEGHDESNAEGFVDDPLFIARTFGSDDLTEVFRGAIEDGSGTVNLENTVNQDVNNVVPVEAVRDALQIQGIDTNKILQDIADAGPNAQATGEDNTVADSIENDPVTQVANEIATEYDLQGMKKVGGQQGSNEGGTYEDAEGNQAYVKTPKSDLHAQNEVLASALYRLLDVPAAEMYLASFDDGKIKTYSPMIPDAKSDLKTKLKDPEYLKKLQDGFAVDAWLANWDVAGLVFDNVVTDENGDPVRVDPGGALLFRAMGAPKGKAFGDKVTELDTLRDPKMNPQSASIFGSMTEEQQKESARKLLDISNEDIETLVHSVITDEKVASDLASTLEARRADILDRYGLLADDTSTIVDNAKIEEPNTISESKSTPTPETKPAKVPSPGLPKDTSKSKFKPEDYVTSDGVQVELGMQVTHKKTGMSGKVVKYDAGNNKYVYVDSGGKKPLVTSLNQLVANKGGGGGESKTPKNPKTPEPKSEEPAPAVEKPSAPETSSERNPIIDGVSDKGKLDNGVTYSVENAKVKVSPFGKGSSSVDGVKITLGGNTYKNKDLIKQAGFKWDSENKVWYKQYVELASFPNLSKSNAKSDLEKVGNMQETPKTETPTPSVEATPTIKAPSSEIVSGSEVTDAKGNTGFVKKINKDNYALVQFSDGKEGWRSLKTLQSTGNIDNSVVVQQKTKLAKITGAGVEPVVPEKPSDWTTSEFDSIPSLADGIKKMAETDNVREGKAGLSVAVDSDSLEDLDVRIMKVKNPDDSDGIRLKFKLTNWAGNQRTSGLLKIAKMSADEREAYGFNVENLSVDYIKTNDDGSLQLDDTKTGFKSNTGRVYTITTKDGITIKFHRANDNATSTVKMDKYSGSATAFHNMVTIQAPANATTEQIAHALAVAGVQDVRPSTPADAKILIENRLMSVFDRQNDPKKNLSGAEREASLKRIETKYGITSNDVTLTTGASGRIETNLSDEAALKLWEAVGKPAGLYHSISTRNVQQPVANDTRSTEERFADYYASILGTPQGGLLSTTTRWSEGIGGNGMSSQQDIATGGADYIFVIPKVNMDAKTHGVYGNQMVVYFDPKKVYKRLDFFANTSDKFGKRIMGVDTIQSSRPGYASEIMFKQRLSFSDLDSLIVSNEMKSLIMQRLHDMGISEIGGRPIEDVLVVPGSK